VHHWAATTKHAKSTRGAPSIAQGKTKDFNAHTSDEPDFRFGHNSLLLRCATFDNIEKDNDNFY
jgi:hypothetical protein